VSPSLKTPAARVKPSSSPLKAEESASTSTLELRSVPSGALLTSAVIPPQAGWPSE
jgi:hypothetical protein